MKSALTIAGSDSSGGAGIQADIKTMTMHGVFAESVITALTAQNTLGVTDMLEIPSTFVKEQIVSVFEDIRPDAVKIGMISSPEIVRIVAESLRQYDAQNIVLDPVMVATSGSALSSAPAVEALKEELIPIATVITPNIPEAEALSGMTIRSREDMVSAARIMVKNGAQAVLVKGGHFTEDLPEDNALAAFADDLLYVNDSEMEWFSARRIDTANTHGTGCTLSSAIAANLAWGESLSDAVRLGKAYLTQALAHDPGLGKGCGPLNHAWRLVND